METDGQQSVGSSQAKGQEDWVPAHLGDFLGDPRTGLLPTGSRSPFVCRTMTRIAESCLQVGRNSSLLCSLLSPQLEWCLEQSWCLEVKYIKNLTLLSRLSAQFIKILEVGGL